MLHLQLTLLLTYVTLPFIMLHMRRTDRQQDSEFALEIIAKAEYGVLSMVDSKGNPYAIPISPALVGNTIYIHSATVGAKLDIMANNNKVSLTCVGYTHLLPNKFSTYYNSAIAYGIAELVTDNEEKKEALLAIAKKYAPGFPHEAGPYIERRLEQTAVIRITLSQVTAKAHLPPKEQGENL